MTTHKEAESEQAELAEDFPVESTPSGPSVGPDKISDVDAEGLFERCRYVAFAICRGELRSYEVDDAVQETGARFLKWVPKMENPTEIVARAAVRTIAKRVVRVVRRKRSNTVPIPEGLDEILAATEPGFERIDNEMTVCAVLAVLDQIPEKFRNVLILRDFEMLPAEEVMRRENISRNTVYSRRHRAIKMFQQKMNESKGTDLI